MSAPAGSSTWSARIAAAVVLAYVLCASPIVEEIGFSFAAGSYHEKRIQRAFGGMDVDGMRARLDALLPRDAPIGLAPNLSEDPFLLQRLTEGLYPHPVDSAAGFFVVPAERGLLPAWRVLAVAGDKDLVLSGKLDGPEPAPPEVPSPPGLAWSLLRFALAFVALLGLGLPVSRAIYGASVAPSVLVPGALLAGGLVVAWIWSLATWLGVPVPVGALTLLGCAAAAWSLRRAGGLAALRSRLRVPRLSWSWVLAGALLLLAARLAAAPITLWDGRSVWLFQARRIAEHGCLLASEAAAAPGFSHPDYPLFFPAWLAFTSGVGAAFDERAAGLGIALLAVATLVPCAALAREALGRFTGAALVLALYAGLDCSIVGGYADGFLTFLLLLEFLALASERRALGLVAAGAAALIKLEGLPLALLVLVAAALCAQRRPRPRALVASLVVLVPAVVHLAWTRAHGVESLLKGRALAASLAELGPRLVAAVGELPVLFREEGYTSVRSLLVPGAVALVAVPLVLTLRRGGERRRALAAWLLALALLASGLVAIALLPEDAAWFVQTAYDRLAVHGVALALLAFLIVLGRRQETGAPPPADPRGS